MDKNKKIVIIASIVVVTIAAIALLSTQSKKQEGGSGNSGSQSVAQDPNAPKVKFGDDGLLYVARAADDISDVNGATSCSFSIRDLTENLNSAIRVYLMPAICSNNATNAGWPNRDQLLWSFDLVKAGANTATLHDFVKAKLADGKTEAIIFQINQSREALDGTIMNWVQPAAVVETTMADKKVYLYLTDDSTSEQMDYQEFQNQIKSLTIAQ